MVHAEIRVTNGYEVMSVFNSNTHTPNVGTFLAYTYIINFRKFTMEFNILSLIDK